MHLGKSKQLNALLLHTFSKYPAMYKHYFEEGNAVQSITI